jgi:hypothetical protein
MAKDNVVSVWIGNFNSEKDFFEYIRQGYDENGDVVPSNFMNTFGIDNVNVDFQEVLFQESLSEEELQQASYAESFVNKIGEISGNCMILLYDYDYPGAIREGDGLLFTGVFNYNK